MNTAWVQRVDAALREVIELRIRLKDAEERIEALESPVAVLSPETVYAITADAVVKRKPGRPRKNGN